MRMPMPMPIRMGCFSHTHNAPCSLFHYPHKFLHSSHSQFGGVSLTTLNKRVSFLFQHRTFKSLAAGNGTDTETAVIEKEKKPQLKGRFQVSRGYPSPFGATARDGGVNFAIYSLNAQSATLCLISLSDLQDNQVTEYIPLDPLINKTGGVWHVFLKGEFKDMLYGYKFDGKFSPLEGHYYDSSRILLDPYAKAVISRGEFGALGPDGNCWTQMAGMIPSSDDEFDWEGDLPLNYPQKDLIIYEMHVRGFTKHESSMTKFPGTYLGVVEKLDHLKELGVNCIELMPCHEFNELEYYSYNSVQGDYKVNFWGYSTVNYFSPMIRYSSAGIRNCGRDGVNEMKFMIKEAHKRGIEVIMDVVFNHTAEGNEKGPIISFRGVDNSIYYMVAPKGEFYNYSGCGNTFNCNHPFVRQFIVDCLRYWVTEMHVDGFRFDLASIMTRGSSLWDAVNVFGAPIEGDVLTTGTPLTSPPLVDMISNDPILRGVKLIAEAWDAGGLYQVGTFPHWGVWSEWNGKYRDTIRQFIKGTDGFAGAFAECLCGSPNIYQGGGRKPWHSINFVCAHDGFTLADLVTYNNKHNLPNGEDNNDGENHNNSWNCGQEGEFASISVKKLRKRQMRNFFLSLMVSQGVPMIYMGDEYGHTKGGNNNTYCHDNYLNYFRWDKKEESSSDLFRFCRLMTKFRQECESLGLDEFPTSERLQWHGHFPLLPDWSENSRFVAFTMVDSVKGEIYIGFNTSHLPFTITLPERPGYRWEPLVDTAKPAPYDFLTHDVPGRDIAIQQTGMAGYKLLKRKGLDDDGLIDNFSDFPLSSPATKIRRLDADLPPIAEVDLELDHDEPLTAPTPEPVEPEVEAPNEERAIVLFKPPSHSPSPFSFTLNPDFISQIKNQVPWSSQRDSDCDRLLKSAADREEQEKKNRGMALVPWVPSTSTSTSYQFPILHETTSTDLMEAEELREGEASMEMDVEQQDISINSPSSTIHPTATTLYPSHDGGLHQWNQQQQQQQHCLLPQIPQSTSTPITWTR